MNLFPSSPMSTRPDDLIAIDEVFSQYGKDTAKENPQAPSKAEKAPESGMLRSAVRSGMGSLFKSAHASVRKGRRNTEAPEQLETRLVMSGAPVADIENPTWQNTPEIPADALGYIDAQPGAFMFDIAISPDGSLFASSGSDRNIHIHNAKTGFIEKTLSGHGGLVMNIDFNTDGTKLVSVSYDNTARIWDTQTGALLQTINLPHLGIKVDWSPRGDLIAIGVHENPIQLFNVATGAITLLTYPVNTEAVRFDFAEDGNSIACTYGTNVVLRDTANGNIIRTLTGVSEPVYSVDMSPDGTYVAAGTSGGKLIIWDTVTGAQKSVQPLHHGGGSEPGNVTAVQFMKGNSPHIVSSDHTGLIITQNIEGLSDGRMPVEVQRHKERFALESIDSTPNGQRILMGVGNNANKTRALLYDMPDPPAPPAPEPEPEPPVYGPELPSESPAVTLSAIEEYAVQTMADLRISIEADSATLPKLQRRNGERARDITTLETAIAPAQLNVASAETYVQTVEAELAVLNAQYAAAVQSGDTAAEYDARQGIDKKLKIRANAYANLEVQRNILQPLLDQKATLIAEIHETALLIESIYERLRTQTLDYAALASINGQDEAAALAEAETFISNGLQSGYNTMPHAKMDITILDRQMGSSDIPAHFLSQNITEIQEHPSPVLTKSGGLLKIFGRVTNSGNRAGDITVHITGVSDRYPTMPDQYAITVYLNPGESRDFVSTVLIPAGTDSTGSLQLRATTPDEEPILQEVRNRESRSMDSGYYIQGEGAVLHNTRVIAMTEGSESSAERLKNYLAANPTEASSIARKIETGEIARDDFAEKFLVAEGMSRTMVEARRILLAAGLGMNTDDLRFNTAIGPSLDIRQLIIPQGIRTESEKISMFPGSFASRTFTLTEDKMVNFWVSTTLFDEITNAEGFSMGLRPDFSLTLLGKTTDGQVLNGGIGHTSNKGGASGESISLLLPPGTYSINVADRTDYSRFSSNERATLKMPDNLQLQMNVKPFDNRNIEGRISIGDSNETMPVSLRVAEFDGEENRRLDYKNLTHLNPDLPVWIVIHGRTDNEGSDQMEELATNLQGHTVQVVTLDWNKAAADNLSSIDLNGSKWIATLGKWAVNQLKTMGFKSEYINIVGHSWGTFVGYEIARNIQGGINNFVALDSAKDSEWLLSTYIKWLKEVDPENPSVDFARVSSLSYAFHSSFFGSAVRALTADYTFRINAPENYENGIIDIAALRAALRGQYLTAAALLVADEGLDAFKEHGFAVTLFSQLLKEAANSQDTGISKMFKPKSLSSSNVLKSRPDHYEGIFHVQPTKSKLEKGPNAGRDWWKAQTYYFDGQDKDGNSILE